MVPDEFVAEHNFILSDGRSLLFATRDSPFEEEVCIQLFDATDHLVAEKRLGGAYTPGILMDVTKEDDHRFTFSFPESTAWELSIDSMEARGGLGWLFGRSPLRLKRLR